MDQTPGKNSPQQIKQLRHRLGLTQVLLAERLGVSFPTVNRWENGKSVPSQLAWNRLLELAGELEEEPGGPDESAPEGPPVLDFTARPEVVSCLIEGERLSFGHLANPAFATEISNIDPLPHQRIAVYDHMLKQARLRFLLADDAGAGKTIMTGLYTREMLSRRLLRRVLIVPPAGLIGNWQAELQVLFNLTFGVVTGADAKNANPFMGPDSDRIIVSVDTLAGSRVFSRLREEEVEPYDLVVFDEAHKLSVNRGTDLRVRPTDRYRLAEALAGVRGLDPAWRLPWSPHHLLLLTATPHQGKDYPYYGLWRLLEPDVLATPEAFDQYPPQRRQAHFIRRTKEEMVHLSGKPLYPKRISDTLGYDLTQGEVSEQTLYDETTDYMRHVYNRAKLLNRSAARLAMSVLQRRLASSTYALLRSFERRIDKLDELIRQVQEGRLTEEQLIVLQRRLAEEEDVLDSKTADEETSVDGREESEVSEDRLLAGVIAASLTDLVVEREQVVGLRDLARKVYQKGEESKFDKLREVLTDPKFSGEKFIVFTEHRDTLEYLIQRLGGMGYTGQIAQIHGGMYYTERQQQVERFRRTHEDGGARFMICTDAAAEGINLQFCWIMINFDVPWNPARLEQRMGRIHRYGQKHDPVRIINLVAPKTREGLVIETLLNKLEAIRDSLGSEKVFDSIGRLFEGVSLKAYMERSVLEGGDCVAHELEGRLTPEQVEALAAKERMLYGDGGDVKRQLPRLREDLAQEVYRRLLPGYVRHYLENATPLVDIHIDGDMDRCFSLRPAEKGAIDPLLESLEVYTPQQRQCLTVFRPEQKETAVWVHPGEPVFEQIRALVSDRLSRQALRGAVFVDPTAEKPYLFHVALVRVIRQADPELPELATEEILDCRLVGLRQFEGVELSLCPVEHLLLLRSGHGLPPAAQRLAARAENLRDQAEAFLVERVARDLAKDRRNLLLNTLPEREQFIIRGFNFQETELATARVKQSEKARGGNVGAMKTLKEIKLQQRSLAERRNLALATIRREPELIAPGTLNFVAHAMIVPSSDPEDLARHDASVERVAMEVARGYEEAEGAVVTDVHLPALARAAGLADNPGFDLHAEYPHDDPRGRRAIEVKGRARSGDVEVSSNEWAKAANLREGYWLYVVYDCATPAPRLVRVQDPFGALLAKAKGSVLIHPRDILAAAIQ
ncbi:MAG: helicase-related protein [Thermoguttaceae bacterium]|jgi:superfamily II DNA or RNA helicase/DNA-binding XRE family transcriptional regulator